MKHVRLTGRPDPAATPPTFRVLADSAHVAEARLLDWNPAGERGITGLFAVDGEPGPVREALEEAPEVVSAEFAPVGDGRFSLLVTLDPGAIPTFGEVFEPLTRDGLVIVKPVVYRDGCVHASLVGTSAVVQAAVEHIPPSVAVEVRAVGESGYDPEPAAGLTDRQREALAVARELGYYDVPRRATHDDVAAAMGCATSTASEHLQKAEATLVRRALGPG